MQARQYEEREKFKDFVEAASCFQTHLRAARIPQRYLNAEGSSWDAWMSFLKATRHDTEASLIELIKNSRFVQQLESDIWKFQNDYKEFESRYHDVPVDIVLYFIEDALMRPNSVLLHKVASFKEKIVKIRSAILWLEAIFPDGRHGVHWHEIFVDHEHQILKQHLDWVNRPALGYFIQGQGMELGPIEQDDLYIADVLWNWFETHPRAPIKLIHAMVLCGMDRDVGNEKFELRTAVSKLRKAIYDAEDLSPKPQNENYLEYLNGVQNACT